MEVLEQKCYQYHRKAKNDTIRNGATVVFRTKKAAKFVYPKCLNDEFKKDFELRNSLKQYFQLQLLLSIKIK